MRYIGNICASIFVITLVISGCNNSPTSSKNEILSAITNQTTYSIYDTVIVNIQNNTEEPVYFKYYDNQFTVLSEVKIDNNWILAELFVVQSGAILNARIFEPDSNICYKQRVQWTGKSRMKMPYNIDGSLSFPDTLFSNTFTIE